MPYDKVTLVVLNDEKFNFTAIELGLFTFLQLFNNIIHVSPTCVPVKQQIGLVIKI